MQFRKNPVTIEARQMPLDPDPADRSAQQALVRKIAEWMVDNGHDASVDYEVDKQFQYDGMTLPDHGATYLEIETLEGVMTARPGWWIIQGVKGEFYPCDPEIFAATYTPADAPVRVPIENAVIVTDGGEDAVRLNVARRVVERRVPRSKGEGFDLTFRSAELVSLHAQEWVHPEDGETVA